MKATIMLLCWLEVGLHVWGEEGGREMSYEQSTNCSGGGGGGGGGGGALMSLQSINYSGERQREERRDRGK